MADEIAEAELKGPVQPVLDLWSALRGCGNERPMPPLGPEHVKVIALAFQQARLTALKECREIIDKRRAEILSKQTPNADPLSIEDSVNANLRMIAVVLPELSAAILSLEKEG